MASSISDSDTPAPESESTAPGPVIEAEAPPVEREASPPLPPDELEAHPAEPPPPPPAPSFGVGATLRAARQTMGKSLADCSHQLRIRQPFLEALEDGRHADLPGGTYAAGFLRTYAEYLSLDGEEMVRRFRQEGAGGFTVRAELSFPSPVTEGRIPGGAVIFLGLALAVVAYGGWYALSSPETTVAEIVPPLPERLSSILTRQAALTGENKTEATPPSEASRPAAEDPPKSKEDVVPPSEAEDDKSPQPQVQTLAPTAPAPAETASPEPPKLVEPVKTPEPPKLAEPVKTPEPPKLAEPVKAPEPPKLAEPVKAPEPPKLAEPVKTPEPPKPAEVSPTTADGRVFGTENPESRVMLKAANDDCWVQVRELDGSLLLSRLLRRGDSYRVPSRPGLVLMVGNAGALEVSVDGRKAPSLGAAGQVRRDIRLDPDKLLGGG